MMYRASFKEFATLPNEIDSVNYASTIAHWAIVNQPSLANTAFIFEEMTDQLDIFFRDAKGRRRRLAVYMA